MPPPETSQQAFDRGHAAGEIAAKLAEHDQHLAKINGSMERVAEELKGLRLELQRQNDASASRDEKTLSAAAALKDATLATASALKDADQARRDRSEQGWSPVAKLFAVLAALATVVGLLMLLVPHVRIR